MNIDRRAILGGAAARWRRARRAARDWPEKPVTWVVPFPAGGPSDGFARTVAELVGGELGQTVVIDNKSGAGGSVGAAVVCAAPPDGYTMLVGFTGNAYAPLIYANPGFDLLRDFAPIAAIDRVQSALLVNPKQLDVTTLEQFLDAARRQARIDRHGVGRASARCRISRSSCCRPRRIKLRHVPYRGGAPALQDLLGGQVAGLFATVGLTASYVRAGTLRALAVAGRRREPLLPDVPTFEEAGARRFPRGVVGRPVRAQGHARRRCSTACTRPCRRRWPARR